MQKVAPIPKDAATESFQEGAQFFSKEFGVRYHTDKYSNGGYGDMSKAMTEALAETFGSNEGLESMLVGAIVGGIMGVGGAFNNKAASEERKTTATLKSLIDAGIFNAATQRLTNANAQAAAMARMQKAVQEGDIKAYKDAQSELITYNALQIVQLGGAEVLEEKLAHLSEMPDSEFAKAMHIELADDQGNERSLKEVTGQTQAEIIDDMRTKVKEVTDTYYAVNDVFAEPPVIRGLPKLLMGKEKSAEEEAIRGRRQALKEKLVIFGSAVKDRTRRMHQIEKEMSEIEKLSLSPSQIAGALGRHSSYAKSQGTAIASTLDLNEEYMQLSRDLEELKNSALPDDILQAETVEQQSAAIEKYTKAGQLDKIAAMKMVPLIKDYRQLLKETSVALDSYNKLASALYENGKEARKEAEKIEREQAAAQAAARQERFNRELELAENETQLTELIADEELSPQEQFAAMAKLSEIRAARKKVADNIEEFLRKGDPSEEEYEKRLAKLEEDKAKEEDADPLTLEALYMIRQRYKARKGQDEARKKKKEEEAAAEEARAVKIISENGREISIPSIPNMIFMNTYMDPLDAIRYNTAGEPDRISLRTQSGVTKTIYKQADLDRSDVFQTGLNDISVTEEVFDQILYAILLTEAVNIHEANEIAREEVEVRQKAIARKKKRMAFGGKHGQKSSALIRYEIYELQNEAELLFELWDEHRTYMLSEGYTKTAISKDPDLKDLKKKIDSAFKQIRARMKVLSFRDEDLQLTTTEALEVEGRLVDELEDLRDERERIYEEFLTVQEMWNDAEAIVKRYEAEPETVTPRDRTVAKWELQALSEELFKLKEDYAVIKQMFLDQELLLKKHRYGSEKDDKGAGSTPAAAPQGSAPGQIYQGEDPNTPQAPPEVTEQYDPSQVGSFTEGLEAQAAENLGEEASPDQQIQSQTEQQFAQQQQAEIDAAEKEFKERLARREERESEEEDIAETLRKEEKRKELLARKGQDEGEVEAGDDVVPVGSEAETRTKPQPTQQVSEVESKLNKPFRTVNDGSGKMVVVSTETTEKEGIKKTKFKTQTTNRKGEPRTQNDKGYNTFEEAVDNLDIDLQSEENETALELVEVLKETQAKESLPARVVEIRESTDKSSPFFGLKTATVIVGGEKIEFRLKQKPTQQSSRVKEAKADIERRRKEELISAVTTSISYEDFSKTKPKEIIVNDYDVYEYDNSLKKYVVVGAASSTDTSLESIAAREKGAKDVEFFRDKSLRLDTVSFFWAERTTGRSPIDRLTSYKERTKQGRIDERVGDKLVEINAKYDAELAALEDTAPAQSTQQSSRVKEAETLSMGDEIKGANMDSIMQETVVDDFGNRKEVSRIKVDAQGEILDENTTNTVDGEKVIFDRDDLNGAPPESYELFLFENDWYKENYPEGSIPNVPVAYGYRDEQGKKVYVGVLKNEGTAVDNKIRENLSAGKRVRLPVKSVGASTPNNARTEGFEKVFYDPKETFQGTGMDLAFVGLEFDKDTGTSTPIYEHGTQHDLSVREPRKSLLGQVGFIIPGSMVPGGNATVLMASTANLTEEAKDRVKELIQEEDLPTVSEIVATIDPSMRTRNQNSRTFFEQGQFKDGLQYIVFYHAAAGELVRINSSELKAAMNGGKFKASVVRVDPESNTLKAMKASEPDVQKAFKEINKNFPGAFQSFLDIKKFNVSKDLAYTEGKYRSPINPERVYEGGYMEYLTSTEEMGGQERTEGLGHYSILSTDVVRNTQEGTNPLFTNPDVTFGNSKSTELSAEETADAVTDSGYAPSGEVTEKGQQELDSIDDMFKDEKCSP